MNLSHWQFGEKHRDDLGFLYPTNEKGERHIKIAPTHNGERYARKYPLNAVTLRFSS